MANDIKTRITIDGEADYKKALTNITAKGKELQSELTALTSGFDKSTSAEEKNAKVKENLTRQIANQMEKVGTLQKQVQQCSAAYGENDTRTIKLRDSLNKATAELNRMQTEFDNVGSAAEDAGNSSSRFGDILKANLISDAVIAGVKALASAMKEVASAAVGFGKDVVNAYADFEQLQGGINKLFGDDAAKQVMKNANNAFAGVGLSANQYMESVTGFSARLINDLGQDTNKAADVADKAMRQIADNANTFGKYSVEELTTVYQALAKGQYQTLDNLNLGYNGSKEGMEDLIKRANELKAANGEMANLTIDNFADIIEAIGLIQEKELNIKDTTEKEAKGTITGSINMMKSAWQNFVTELGKDNADLDTVFGNLEMAFTAVKDNIMPVIERLISYIPQLTSLIIPAITSMLPTLVQGVGTLLSQLVTAIIPILPVLIPAAIDAINTINAALLDNIDLLVQAAIELVLALTNGIIQAIPQLIEAIPQLIDAFVNGIFNNLPAIITAGVKLLQALIEGIISMIGSLATTLANIGRNVYESFGTLADGARTWGRDLLQNFINGIGEKLSALWTSLKNVAQGVRNYLGFSEPKLGPLSNFHTYAPDMMQLFAKGITDNKGLIESAINRSFDLNPTINAAMGGSSAYNYGGFNIVVNASDGQSAQDIADEIMYRINNAVNRREAVFA